MVRVHHCGADQVHHHRLQCKHTMPHEQVQSSGVIPASAEQTWTLLRNFHGTWHPAINTMKIEHDEAGRLIRAFTVHGEKTTYRERLTWFSDSDKSFAYTHIDGIAGVDDYSARLSVLPESKNQCRVLMSAQLNAPAPRAAQIAAGTKAIFDSAINAIKTLKQSESPSTSTIGTTPSLAEVAPHTETIEGSPALAIARIDGPITDTVCLFLHGIGGNKSNWQQQLRCVAPYCTAVALDLRGYGESSLGDNQTTIEDYCDDILRVANALKAKKLILCGLSYGSWIATSFAMRHPGRLAGLVLSGGCTGMSEASADECERFRASRELPLSQGKTPADFADAVVTLIAGPSSSESVKAQLRSSMEVIPTQTYADALRCFTNPIEQFDLSRINVPVLLMTGDADKLAPPSEIKKVAERIHRLATTADVCYECLEKSGHVCNLDAAVSYNFALVALVRRLVSHL